MKVGRTLSELAAEIERRAATKIDLLVSTQHLDMVVTDYNMPALHIRDREGNLVINEIAHDQIGTYTEIPAKYYDRMRQKNPALLAVNVNAWFNANPEARLVRTLDGVTRAFLSDRYRPLENEDLAMAVLPALGELDLAVMSCEITDRRLYIKAVDRKVERELAAIGGKFGDGRHNIVRCLSPAITISNSEVGLGSLAVLTGVYDGFCSNLATFHERSTRKYHVGARHELGEEVFSMLSDETRHKTDAATWAQIRDITKAAFEKARFDALCDKIMATTEQKIEGDPIKTVNLSGKRFGLNEGEQTGVLRYLIEGGDLSRFGLYNAVTRYASDAPSYDRSTELEQIGGGIIDLTAGEWKDMATAE